jgi:hypothetical protein
VKYWKVLDGSPISSFVPGYSTNNPEHVEAYVSASFSRNDPEKIVYVVEFDIDIDTLVEVEYSVGGFNQDKTIKPGYFGPPDSEDDAHPTTDPYEVVVYNEPVSAKVVGAYKSGLSVDPTKDYQSGYYLKNSNFHRDSRNGKWTTDDLNIKTSSELNLSKIASRVAILTEPKTCDDLNIKTSSESKFHRISIRVLNKLRWDYPTLKKTYDELNKKLSDKIINLGDEEYEIHKKWHDGELKKGDAGDWLEPEIKELMTKAGWDFEEFCEESEQEA